MDGGPQPSYYRLMVSHVPKTIQTEGRLYTTQRERAALGMSGTYGQGTCVAVGLVRVDRGREWGIYGETATFETALASDGEIYIPQPVLDDMAIEIGDDVRITVQRVDE